MGGRDLARHACRVLGVVVLHPHAVTAGHHHRRVGGTRLRALLDDDPGLGPRPEARHHARSVANLHGPAGEVRVLAGQRGDAGGDAAVSGQRLVHEGEAVVNHLATRPVRDRRHAGLAGLGGTAVDLAADAGVRCREHADEHHQQGGQDHADHPAAHAAELGPLGAQEPAEARPARAVTGGGAGLGLRGRLRGHRPTSSASAASKPAGRNSTASLVSSMYACSSVARCADTSENGTALPLSSATTRSAGSPEIMSASAPVAATVAPASSSTVVAFAGADVRSVTRSPDAAASRLATVVSAMTRPRPTTTRWSAVSWSSLIRWLDTSTARPSAASPRRKPRVHTMPSGSMPLNGSSSMMTAGLPSIVWTRGFLRGLAAEGRAVLVS